MLNSANATYLDGLPHALQKPRRLSSSMSSLVAEAKAWQSRGAAGSTLGNGPVPLDDGMAWLAQRPGVAPKSHWVLTSASVAVTDLGTGVTQTWVQILPLPRTSWANMG